MQIYICGWRQGGQSPVTKQGDKCKLNYLLNEILRQQMNVEVMCDWYKNVAYPTLGFSDGLHWNVKV